MKKSPQNRRQSSSFCNGVKFTPEIHRDGEWYVGVCPEVPEANGQGRTPEECLQSLKDGVFSILEDRKADAAKNGITKNGIIGHRVPEAA